MRSGYGRRSTARTSKRFSSDFSRRRDGQCCSLSEMLLIDSEPGSSHAISRLPTLRPCASPAHSWYSATSIRGNVAISSSVGSPPQVLLQLADRRLDQASALALLARSPVHLAQAVENGAANLVLGIRLQLDALRCIITVDRRDQADDAGGDKVVQADVAGKPVVDAAGDQFNLGHVLHNQLLALVLVQGRFYGCCAWESGSFSSAGESPGHREEAGGLLWLPCSRI